VSLHHLDIHRDIKLRLCVASIAGPLSPFGLGTAARLAGLGWLQRCQCHSGPTAALRLALGRDPGAAYARAAREPGMLPI
jgi:hypothetical protein